MNNIYIFISGGILGSILTWKIVEKKYKKIADQEIESVIYTFDTRRKELEKKYTELKNEKINELDSIDNTDNKITEYQKTINELKYNSENDSEFTDTKLNENIKPYIISPFEFGENNYEERTLMYCSDNVIIGEDSIPIDEPELILGDTLSEFCLDDDSLYVRDETNMIDYEILRNEKTSDQILLEESSNDQ